MKQHDPDPATTSPNLVANNVDPDGTTVTVTTVVSTTGGGGTTITGAGTTIDYTPASNFNGIDTVIYTACDAGTPLPAACVNDTLFVTVNPVNDFPDVPGTDTLTTTTPEGTPIQICLTTTTDVEMDALDVTNSFNGPNNGGITGLSDNDTCFTYTPTGTFNGNDTVTVVVCDNGAPSRCDTIVTIITVTPFNDPPSQGNETLTITEDDPATTSPSLVANNTDPDGTAVTVTTVVSTTGGGGTTITGAGTTIDYTPALNFNGIDTVIYTACDAGTPLPAACVNDTLFVTVNPVNDPPAQGNENMTVSENDPATTSPNLVANNTDPDGTAVTVTTVVSTTAGGGTTITGAGTTIDYTPFLNFNGIDTVIYTVCDAGNPMPAACVNDTLFVTVNPVNNPPDVPGSDTLTTTTPEGTPVQICITTATDVENDLIDITSSFNGPNNGGITGLSDNDTCFTYTPTGNFNGNDTVTVEVCDNGAPSQCDTVVTIITVTPVNDPPAQGNETLTVTEDDPATTSPNLVANNTDPDGTAVTVTTVVSTTGGGGTSITGVGTTIDYTPLANFNGIDTVIYTVCDAGTPLPAACVNDTLFVTVNPVNDPPAQGNETMTVAEGDPATTSSNLVANNTDPDGTAVTVTTVISTTGGGGTSITGAGTTIDYTPAGNFNGIDTVIYTVCDAGTPLPASCVNDTLFVTVTPVNDPPAQGNESMTINEDDPATTSPSLIANNVDPDGTIVTVTTVVSTTGGGGTTITGGGTTIDYTPALNFNGIDTVIYTACDAGTPLPAACVNDTLFVTVNPVNDFPDLPGTDTLTTTTPEGTPIQICLTTTTDAEMDDLDVTNSFNGPNNGGITGLSDNDTCFTYTPTGTFNGNDTVTVEVCDNGAPSRCDTIVTIITVTPVNDPPAQGNESMTINEDDPATTSPSLIANNVDPDGTIVTVTTVVSTTGGGGTTITGGGTTIDYTPALNFNGIDTVIYTACDAGTPLPIACVNDTLFVTVNPVNDFPDLPGTDTLTTTTPEGTPIQICLTATTDVEMDDLDVTNSFNGPNNGGITGLSDNDTCFTYTPTGTFNGNDTVTVVVCDNGAPSRCDTIVTIITVTPVNDPPSQGNESMTINEDDPATTSPNLTANNVDPDGTAITVTTVVSTTGGGSTTITGAGTTIDYTPALNFNGIDTVIYTACDAGTPLPAACVNDTLFVTVNPVNDFPDLPGTDTLTTTTPEGTPIQICLTATTDVEMDDLDVTNSFNGPNNGGITGLSDNDTCFTYTPTGTFNGNDTVTVVVCDNGAPSRCDTIVTIITVTPVNDPPSQGNESMTINEDDPATTSPNLTANNVDPDGTAITVTTVVSTTGGGGTTITGAGTTIDYTPALNFNGIDTVIYTACDAGTPLPAACVNDTLFVTVNPVNDFPDLPGTDTVTTTTPEGTPVQICLTTTTDVEMDDLDVTNSFNGPNNGGITGLSDNDTCITYTPTGGFNGNDTVTVVVCDNGAPSRCDTIVTIITVTPINDPPVALNDSIIIPEDTSNVTIDVQVNDTDPDGDPLVTTVIGGTTSGGTITVQNNDSLSYTPPTDFVGNDTITYQVCDAGALCDTAIVIVTVNPVIDTVPISLPEDSTITVCADSLTDFGTTATSVTLDCGPSNGMTNIVGTCIDYTPTTNFNGMDTICVISCNGILCDTSIVIITVTPRNDPPVALNDSITIPEDTSNVVIDVQVNDTDPDGDPLVTTVIGGTTAGGTVVVLNTDSLDYTPPTDFVGNDTITYQVCDAGALCDTAIVIVTVNPVIDTVPISLPEDSTITVCADSLTDFGTTATSVTLDCGPSNGMTNIVGTCIDYTPTTNFNGMDTICVISCNGILCDTSIVIITVTPRNDPPVALNDSITIPEDTSNVVIDVQVNDTDPDGDPLVTTVIGGTTAGGTVVVLNTDSLDYTPPTNFVGNDTITYQVCDAGALCDTAIVIVTVEPVIDTVPVTTPEDSTITICADSLTDFGTTATSVTLDCGPSNGMTNIVGTCIDYTPTTNFTGMDTICVISCNGILCDTSIVIITVTPRNDPPVALNDSITIPEDTSNVVIDVQVNDTDPDGDPLVTTVIGGTTAGGTVVVLNTDSLDYTPPTDFVGNDTITYQVCDAGALCDTAIVIVTVDPVIDTVPVTTPEDSTITICADSLTDFGTTATSVTLDCGPSNGMTNTVGTCIDYTPTTNFTGMDTICVISCNGTLCDTSIVIITVTPRNDPPVAFNDSITIPEDTSNVVIDVQVNDTDPDGDPLVTTVIGGTTAGGTVVVLNTDSLDYTPPTDFVGNDTITYQVCDAGALCDTAIVIVTVTPVIDTVPISLPEDSTITVCADSLTDFGTTATSVTLDCGPSNGMTNIVGTCIDYTPTTNFNGMDTICVISCNGILCDTSIVIITVIPVNDPPIALDDSTSIPEDTSNVIITVQVNDTDPDGDPLVTTVIGGTTAGGTVVVLNGDSLDYTPPTNFVGNDTITYQVCDTGALCDTAIVIVTVVPVTDTLPNITTPNDSTITICGDSITFFTPDTATSVTLCGGPTNGTVIITGTCIDYTPDSTFIGIDTTCIIVCNGTVCDTTVIIITVTGTFPPIAVNDSVVVDSLISVISVLGNDTVPVDTVTITIIDPPLGGTGMVDTSNWTITYTPDFAFCGLDSFSYEICNSGGCDTAWVITQVFPFDSDGDGIPDFIETLTLDTDNDGVLNYLSQDSDGDGVPDSVEAWGDLSDPCFIILQNSDGDSLPDILDPDDDEDGILTQDELDEDDDGTFDDCDEDGIPDYLDHNICPTTTEDLSIPEGFSPNNDGTNDFWRITGIEAHPDNSVIIFNRWGNKVYESKPYNNDWDGTNIFGVSLSRNNQLPEGTYFFLFKKDEADPDSEVIKGTVYIKR